MPENHDQQKTMWGFDNPDAVARYAEGPRKQVPGHDSLLVMTDVLLSEKVADDGEVLVVGAGGGLELTQLARNHPDWRFVGVDPSAPMLALAEASLGPMTARARMHCGYVDSAPMGLFDGATCLLTLHFVPVAERLATLRAIHDRLKPGAPFICAHYSVPGDAIERGQWFARNAAFAERSGMPAEMARAGAVKIAAELPILTPAEDESLLAQAGFGNVRQFYASFTFRGWVCEAM